MEYTNLGRSGLKVSKLCLGTMNFGPHTTEADAFRIMDRALEHGINFFDTANVYARPLPKGTTESIIGKWFAQGGGRRDKVVLATKLYGEMEPWPNNARYSALSMRRACEGSLKRLQTDYIDLYQMHHIARELSWDEIWQAFEQLYASGKIIYNGSSNFAGWHIAAASEAARKRNYFGLISEQSFYSLVERAVELEVIPACQHYGLGLLPYSPLFGGLLGGKPKNANEGRRSKAWDGQELEDGPAKIEKYEMLCNEYELRPSIVGLAWLLQRPGVSAPIIGPRTIEQLDEAVTALEVKLDSEMIERMENIFPSPGKPAPEAYAW